MRINPIYTSINVTSNTPKGPMELNLINSKLSLARNRPIV